MKTMEKGDIVKVGDQWFFVADAVITGVFGIPFYERLELIGINENKELT